MKNTVKWIVSLLVGLFLLNACATNSYTAQEEGSDEEATQAQTIANPQNLADILIRLPGVVVNERAGGTFVTIRGNRPLFVVDGVMLGNSYFNVENAVNVNDIASVEVLRSMSETALYGQQGVNGVILIKTVLN